MPVPFSGGDKIGVIVAEFGSYTTKIGFAGKDYPRALLCSNVELLRKKGEKDDKLW